MKTKAKIIIMSHLSDAQQLGSMNRTSQASNRIDFVKFLLIKYSDTNVDIDPDKEYAMFIDKYPQKQFSS